MCLCVYMCGALGENFSSVVRTLSHSISFSLWPLVVFFSFLFLLRSRRFFFSFPHTFDWLSVNIKTKVFYSQKYCECSVHVRSSSTLRLPISRAQLVDNTVCLLFSWCVLCTRIWMRTVQRTTTLSLAIEPKAAFRNSERMPENASCSIQRFFLLVRTTFPPINFSSALLLVFPSSSHLYLAKKREMKLCIFFLLKLDRNYINETHFP